MTCRSPTKNDLGYESQSGYTLFTEVFVKYDGVTLTKRT